MICEPDPLNGSKHVAGLGVPAHGAGEDLEWLLRRVLVADHAGLAFPSMFHTDDTVLSPSWAGLLPCTQPIMHGSCWKGRTPARTRSLASPR